MRRPVRVSGARQVVSQPPIVGQPAHRQHQRRRLLQQIDGDRDGIRRARRGSPVTRVEGGDVHQVREIADDRRSPRRQTAQPRRGRFPGRRPPQAQAHVGGGEMRADRLLGDVPRQEHTIGDTVPCDVLLQRRVLARVADEQQPDVASFSGEGADRAEDRREAFLRRHLAERCEHDGFVRQRERAARRCPCRPIGLDRRDAHPDDLDGDARILLAQVVRDARIVDGDCPRGPHHDAEHRPEVGDRSAQPFDDVLREA